MSRRLARADGVPEHTDALHFELDDIARQEPPAVAVFEDAAGAHGPGAEDLAWTELRVERGLRDQLVPGVVHVAELAARALLAVDARDHPPARAVELLRRHDDRPEARREVLALRRT